MPATAAVAQAAAQGASSIINGTVSNLLQNQVYKAQVQRLNFQNRLDQLTTQQQYVIALQLQNAQSDAERLQILMNAQAQVDAAGLTSTGTIYASAVQNQSKNSMTTAIIIIGSLIVLLGAVYFINKND